MIYSTEGLEAGALYTSDGKDVWEVESFFEMPSVTLKNLRTGQRMTGGVGCPNFTPFVPLRALQGDLNGKMNAVMQHQDATTKHQYVCEGGPEIRRPDESLQLPDGRPGITPPE